MSEIDRKNPVDVSASKEAETAAASTPAGADTVPESERPASDLPEKADGLPESDSAPQEEPKAKKSKKHAPETEENLIRLPPRKDAEAERKKRKRIVKLVLLGLAVLIVVFVLLVVLFPDIFNFDAVRRYFHYLGKRDRNDYGCITFDAGGTNDYGTLGDSFVLGTEGGIYLFDLDGSQRLTVQGTVSDPRILTGDDRALCYAMNGSFFAVTDKSGGRILDTTLSGTILDVDLSRDGYICYNIAGTDEKTACTVLNRDGTSIYRYKSSSQYLNLCAVSPKGRRIAVSGLSENNSTFSDAILVLQTDREIVAGSESAGEAVKRLEIGNRLIYDLSFVTDDRICALTENALLFVGADAKLISEYKFDENLLLSACFSGNGFVCLLLRDSMGDTCRLRSFDQNGKLLGQIELRNDVRQLNARDGYIGVLSDSELKLYRKDLSSYAVIANENSATRLLMREDGTALLIGGDRTKLVFP